MFTFLAVLALFLWGTERFLLAGAAFGLAALTRPVMLPFMIFIALLPVLRPWRRHLRAHFVMVIVALAIASIWIVRNAAVFGEFVPVASNGGINLLSGTLETDIGGHLWDGTAWVTPNFDTHPATRVDDTIDEIEIDKIRTSRSLTRIADDPKAWLKARVEQYPKLFIDNGDYLLGDLNLPLKEAIFARRWTVIFTKTLFIGGNLLIMLLAAFGLWSLRSTLVDIGHIFLFPIFGVLFYLPMWIEPRYLLPMMPMILILAAVGARRLQGSKYFNKP